MKMNQSAKESTNYDVTENKTIFPKQESLATVSDFHACQLTL